ncbi:vesicle-associated membrane protein-associated protein B isoform X1 [Drosophila teissieri]|uniref:vesicle-associated membrane protein-associated protein B isoform X1 n=1 Tax=Drosophila teissieri TaxID=7243 RepID=UPI001CBA2D67|nr:vesicle-associated membrane protein-associated protein B isoform X1 [Drosophila teissieri]
MELLSVSPQLLTFYAPYGHSQWRMMTLLNPTDRKVLFKVKSNAWRHYTVNPNTGRLEPYSSSEVIISLKCFDFHEDGSYNHLFIIVSMFAPQDHLNGQTILEIFRGASRRDISSNCLPVRLEAQPFPLAISGLDSLRGFVKNAVDKELQLRQLCAICANRLEVPVGQKKPKRSRHLSKLVIMGSLTLVFFTAYMQRMHMFEALWDNFYSYIEFIE